MEEEFVNRRREVNLGIVLAAFPFPGRLQN